MKTQLRPDLKVICLDRRGGKISRIIIDPDNHQPMQLVVMCSRLHIREFLVPVSLVTEVTEDTVFLNATWEILVSLSEHEFATQDDENQKLHTIGYSRPRYMSYPASNTGYILLHQPNGQERLVEVERGMEILDVNGHQIGKVEGIILDTRNRQGRYLLFQRVNGETPQLISPDLIGDITDNLVQLKIEREHVERLPVYSRRTAHRWAKERSHSSG